MLALIKTIQSQKDATQKFVFYSPDHDAKFEVSLIKKPGDDKDIICVPCQTSCKMGCKFCYLTTHGNDLPYEDLWHMEIVEAIERIIDVGDCHRPTLLISYMGAGEPLANYPNVMDSVHLARKRLTQQGRALRFALSTVLPSKFDLVFFDLISEVRNFTIPMKVHLSLHFTDNRTRGEYLPAATDIKTSIAMLETYHQVTGNPVEIHYTLIEGVNDYNYNIIELSGLLWNRNIPIKILAYSENPEVDGQRSQRAQEFVERLRSRGFTVEYYEPPGSDIGASCGQFNLEDLKV